MAEKKDFKKEMNKLIEQLSQNLKKFSKDAGVFAKKGEKELVKASRIGRFQLDILNLNLQREKVYYDLGKKIAGLRGNKEIITDAVKPFLQRLRKIEIEVRNKKRNISMVKKENAKE